jgi:hypothetical protein
MKINLAGLAGNLAEMTNNSSFLHFIPVVRNPTNATKPSNKKNSPHQQVKSSPRRGLATFYVLYINNTLNPMPRKISRIDNTIILLCMFVAS